LKQLYLSHNNISSIKGLENLPSLNHIELNDNPISNKNIISNFKDLEVII